MGKKFLPSPVNRLLKRQLPRHFLLSDCDQFFIDKCWHLLLTLPVHLWFGVLGLIDGLSLRAKRRACGGRESAYLFHLSRRGAKMVILTTSTVFLVWPGWIAPETILLPGAVLLGVASFSMASTLKKYL